MMKIEKMIELVKELRARTYLGLTECKRALEESDGDIEKAIEALQKKGLKKVDDLILPTEGAVQAATVNGDGFIVEINCQTDFGARSEIFQDLVRRYFINPKITFEDSQSQLAFVSNQLGEKVIIRRRGCFETSTNSVMTVYNHLGGKIAVLMESVITDTNLELPKDRLILNFLDNIAMQIAATKPLAVDRESLPSDLVQKKIAFYEDEVKFKPEQVRKKILDGKMSKWYSEVVLLEQDAVFIGDSGPKGQSVQKEIDRLNLNGLVVIKRFIRYERGEIL